MKGTIGVAALMAAIIALLAGPSAAFAQEEGTTGEPTTTASEPATTETETVVSEPVVEEASEPASTETGTVSTEASGEEASAQSADSSSSGSTESATTEPQPQAKVETSSQTVTNLNKDGSCSVTYSSATPRQGGSPPAGCDRVEAADIPTVNDPEPNETEPIGPINGVTLGLWFDPDDADDVVHWVVISGTLSGTTAIDLHVKGGPDKEGFICTISNVTVGATGTCHTPDGQSVSHVDACPATVPPPPGGGQPPPGGAQPGGGVAGQQQGPGPGPEGGVIGELTTAEAAAPAPGGLPVTGLDALWLFLIGGGLLSGGALMRTRLS